VVALDGGPGRTLVEAVTAVSDWTPDGDVYFTPATLLLGRVPATGGGSEAVEIVTELREGELIHGGLRVLPGGKMGVFQVWYALSGEDAEVWAIDLDTRERRLLVAGNSPSYASTGHLLFGTPDGALMAAPFDPSTAELTGGPSVPVAEGLAIVSPFGLVTYSVSEDGTLIYVKGEAGARSGGQQMWVMDLEGNVQDLLLAPRQITSVGWSPDGESVVYASEGQIYTYNVVLSSVPTQLTFEGINQNPVFSPDRTRVAFSSVREGTDGLDLFVKDLDDDSAPRSIITLEANQFLTQWPSDSLIVFEQRAGGNTNLWTVDLSDPDNPRAEDYLTSESDLRYMVVSPDGTLAAYRSNESGQNEIYIRSFPEAGAQTIVSQGGGGTPFWSPDGSRLYYFTGLGGPLMAARLQRNPVPVVLFRDTLVAANFSSVRPFQGSGLHPEGDRFILAGDVGSGDAAAEPNQIILVQNFFTELRERMGGN